MEIEQINKNEINEQKDLYSLFKDLNEKYYLLEKKQNANQEIIEKNKSFILILNQNFKAIKKYIKEFKTKYEKEINALKEIIFQNKSNIYDNNTDNFKIDKLNNLKDEFDEKAKNIDKNIEEQINDIKKLKLKMINKENELNSYETKNDYIFQSFELLLAEIMKKGDIDEKNYEKLKNISEKLIINDISPYEYTTRYFSETYKYLDKKNELNEERVKKLSQINKKVTDYIDKIEHELNKKNKKGKKDKIIPKTPDNKIEKFRNKYGLRKEDADDKKIKEQLKLYKNDEIKTYQALMNRIVNKK
jgi:hypothetical protein